MRLLIYGLNAAPEPIGIGKYSGEMAAWLAAQGHEVRVIAAPPYYPHWRVAEGWSPWLWRRERRDGVSIIRCPLYVPRRPTGLRRLAHLASFAVSSRLVALWQGLIWRPDAVVAVAPTLMTAPAAWFAGRLCGAGTWLHVQDFEVDTAFGLELLRGGRLRNAAHAIEKMILKRFDRVSAPSPAMCDRLVAKGVVQERLRPLPNWVDMDAIRPNDGPNPFRQELNIDEAAVVALYAGNMNEKQGLELLVDSARRLARRKEIQFVFAGAGPMRPRLRAMTSNLANAKLLPLQPVERLNDLLNLADIHLLPQRANAADLVMPSKLAGMLASARPVVAAAAADSQIARVVSGRGTVVAPGDADAMVGAIERLAGDRERRIKLGDAGRAFAEDEWRKEIVLAGLALELEKLVTDRAGARRRTVPQA